METKPVITAVLMLKSKGANGKIYTKGQILKAGPGEDMPHDVAFHFVAMRHAKNLTEVAKTLKKGKDGSWQLPGAAPEKEAGGQGGEAGQAGAKGGK